MSSDKQFHEPPTLLVSIKSTARLLDLGRTKTYELIRNRDLVAIKLGRRTLVTMTSINALIAAALERQNDNSGSALEQRQPNLCDQCLACEPGMR